MSYGSFPGRRPKGTLKRAAATIEKVMKKTMVNGVGDVQVGFLLTGTPLKVLSTKSSWSIKTGIPLKRLSVSQ